MWPTLSTAVPLETFVPTDAVLIAGEPVGSMARPDWPSDAVIDANAVLLSSAVTGHVTRTLGGVRSTWTGSAVAADSLPTWSLTVPLGAWAPVEASVMPAVSVVPSTPEPALPSCRAGSPLDVNVTVTVSLYQPPPPA